MRTDDRGTNPSATWRLTPRRRAAVARSFLLSAVVFTLAALTGAVLASAAAARQAEAAADPAVVASIHHPAQDPTFARSMVYSGTAALALSVTGMVMVGRRRRLW